MTVGITSIGLAIPSLRLNVRELASLRGVDPNKYVLGLGCNNIALCDADEDAVSLAATAAERALDAWGGDRNSIGLFAVGTETARDMSRPLSQFVADRLDLRGHFRTYEVKHACYGASVAVRQAVEWIASGAADGRVALVVATDVALYAPEDPGEPTQGAGAVAMIIGPPTIAEIELRSYPYAMPVFDFWRPVGEDFPRVDGRFSLQCYKDAAAAAFQAWTQREGADALNSITALTMHCPFPKMVKKGVMHVGESLGLNNEDTAALFENRVIPFLRWNREIGNAYTASLWFSVADALATINAGERIAAFSYGSGAGAELMLLRKSNTAVQPTWAEQFNNDLEQRREVDANAYNTLRTA